MAEEGTACAFHLKTEEERYRYELETKKYFDQNYPGWPYVGIWGMHSIPGTNTFFPGPMPPNSPPYLPVHWISNPDTLYKYTIDLDLFGTPELQTTLERAFQHEDLALTGRIEPWEKFWRTFLPDEQRPTEEETLSTYRVLMFHPGLNSVDEILSMVTIDIPRLLQVSHEKVPLEKTATMYIFDTDPLATESFMGGATFHGHLPPGSLDRVTLQDSIELPDVEDRHSTALKYEDVFVVARREWTITVVADREEFPTNLTYIVATALLILCTSIALSCFLVTSTIRQVKAHQEREAAKEERVRLMLEHERESAEQERRLQDYVAHEVSHQK